MTNTAIRGHCPTCHQPTIATTAGLHLEPDPHDLGIHRPDGTHLTQEEHDCGQRGHRAHLCPNRQALRDRTVTQPTP